MILKARPLALLTASVAALVLIGVVWQVSRGPVSDGIGSAPRPSGSASGVVTTAAPAAITTASPTPQPASAAPPAAPPAPSPASPAVAPTIAQASPRPASVAASGGAKRLPTSSVTATPAAAAATAAGSIKHRVEPSASSPPVLPNEVNAVVDQALSHKALARFLYLEPLARRFVATVDNLGNTSTPNSLWLLRPPSGDFRLARNRSAEDTSLVATANDQRYAGFVRWVETTDTQRLIALYTRLYPLLQQTYVELGHRDRYFNDRVIEVIDLLLATPVQKAPLRVQPAVFDAAAKAAMANPLSASTPPRPRFEMADPALEALTTGQKMMLRVGPQHAARLKLKLTALRAGLLTLAR